MAVEIGITTFGTQLAINLAKSCYTPHIIGLISTGTTFAVLLPSGTLYASIETAFASYVAYYGIMTYVATILGVAAVFLLAAIVIYSIYLSVLEDIAKKRIEEKIQQFLQIQLNQKSTVKERQEADTEMIGLMNNSIEDTKNNGYIYTHIFLECVFTIEAPLVYNDFSRWFVINYEGLYKDNTKYIQQILERPDWNTNNIDNFLIINHLLFMGCKLPNDIKFQNRYLTLVMNNCFSDEPRHKKGLCKMISDIYLNLIQGRKYDVGCFKKIVTKLLELGTYSSEYRLMVTEDEAKYAKIFIHTALKEAFVTNDVPFTRLLLKEWFINVVMKGHTDRQYLYTLYKNSHNNDESKYSNEMLLAISVTNVEMLNKQRIQLIESGMKLYSTPQIKSLYISKNAVVTMNGQIISSPAISTTEIPIETQIETPYESCDISIESLVNFSEKSMEKLSVTSDIGDYILINDMYESDISDEF